MIRKLIGIQDSKELYDKDVYIYIYIYKLSTYIVYNFCNFYNLID